MTKTLVANWKMNMLRSEAKAFIQHLSQLLSTQTAENVNLAVAPTYTCLDTVILSLKEVGLKRINVYSQNVFHEEKGAYTGEVSLAMLREIGISGVIIGHSERRNLFGETSEIIKRKIIATANFKMPMIVCIGESLEARKSGKTQKVLKEQVESFLDVLPENAIIAYEPIWAIGTGLAATADQAEEAHGWIREIIAERVGHQRSVAQCLLYGGSSTGENAGALLSREGIDGLLVGGASLKSDEFARMIFTAAQM